MSKYSDAFGGPDFPHREMETQHMQWGEVRENLCYLLKTRNISMESLRLKIKYMHTHTYIYVSVQFSCWVVSDSLQPHELQHARPPCPSPSPGVHSHSRPLSRWCHPAISSSVIHIHISQLSLLKKLRSNAALVVMNRPNTSNWAPKSMQMVPIVTKLKEKILASWKNSYDKPRQCFKKQTSPHNQGYSFSSSHV